MFSFLKDLYNKQTEEREDIPEDPVEEGKPFMRMDSRGNINVDVNVSDGLARFYNLGEEASFEEQFDHLVNGKSEEGELNLKVLMMPGEHRNEAYPYIFGRRLQAATCLYYLAVGRDFEPTEGRLSKMRELGVMLVGPDYHKTHPETPQETISKLREAKLLFIRGKETGTFERECRDFLLYYFHWWEVSLSEDDLAFY